MFESRHQKVLSRPKFLKRQLASLGVGMGGLMVALLIGILGYHYIAALPWIDSLLDASMILGGMGPVDTLKTDGAKIFASIYALFSGVVFIGVMAIILGPTVHRFLHRFHMDEKDIEDDQPKPRKK